MNITKPGEVINKKRNNEMNIYLTNYLFIIIVFYV
jgi:hypothetical protein